MPRRREFIVGAASLLALGGCASEGAEFESAAQGVPVTPNFDALGRKIPWLDGTRKSVGWVVADDYSGSAVLLDKYGTLAMCQHETGKKINIAFPFQNRAASGYFAKHPENSDLLVRGGYSIAMPVERLYFNPDIDIAFGRISPGFVGLLGLEPIKWAKSTPYGKNTETVMVGFPHGMGNLDARLGRGVIPSGELYPGNSKTPTICNAATAADVAHGDSGGAAFTMSGEFTGVIKDQGKFDIWKLGKLDFGNDLQLTDGYFTPVEAVWGLYASLFPMQAAGVRLETGEQPAPPSGDCAPDRRNLHEFPKS